MDDYALVLNAGSSSLKFCVFQRPRVKAGVWKRGARSKASALRLVYLLRTPTVKVWQSKIWMLRFVTDVTPSTRWLPGCDPNMAVRACWVWDIAWSMAVRDSKARQY